MAALDFDRDGRDWPNREASRFAVAGGLRWHVQIAGSGPPVLLIHGTGAASHSWRDLIPLLAPHATVIAPDLPGHGFTQRPAADEGLALPAMARALGALLKRLGIAPALVVGHSAGAAVAMRLVLDGAAQPRALVSLNGALRPYGGVAGQAFSTLARLMVLNPIVPRLFAWRGQSEAAVARVIEGTGSRLDARGIGLYQRLFSNRTHVASTLAMMANWDLDPLRRGFGRLDLPVTLVVGERDAAVPPADAEEIATALPQARVLRVPEAGHLVHEERPNEIAALLRELLGHSTNGARQAEPAAC